MRPLVILAFVTAVLVGPSVRPVRAIVHPGDVGPNFTKSPLGGGSVSRSDYSGKVVILFLLGYS